MSTICINTPVQTKSLVPNAFQVAIVKFLLENADRAMTEKIITMLAVGDMTGLVAMEQKEKMRRFRNNKVYHKLLLLDYGQRVERERVRGRKRREKKVKKRKINKKKERKRERGKCKRKTE